MPDLGHEREIIDGLLEDAAAALERGAMAKAKALYRGILAQHPNHPVALKQLAALEVNDGDPALAVDLFRRAGGKDNLTAELCHGMATALRLLGDMKAFRLALDAALRIDPAYAPAIYDLAQLHQQNKDYAGAERTYKRLLARGAMDEKALFNCGVISYRRGDLVAAERWFHAAVWVAPETARGYINLAMIYRTWGYVTEAVACLARAVELAPENAEAHWNYANALLWAGDFEKGFAEYEWRFRRLNRGERQMGLPRWTGEDLGGRTILLTLEQGLGDAIHFIRFARDVAARGGRVVVECQPALRSLLATAEGVAATVTPGEVLADAACYAPLMSLPTLLGLRLETLPPPAPYLSVPKGAHSFNLEGDGYKVGLVWRGNPLHEADDRRSVSLDLLAALLDVPNVLWFSLQVGDAAGEIAGSPWAGRIVDLGPRLTDFAATASAVRSLDLVISVDTAVAHLAGALGVPVWTLISEANDWRWLARRSDTPWYTSMRLFRQHRGRNWQTALANIKTGLTRRANPAPH